MVLKTEYQYAGLPVPSIKVLDGRLLIFDAGPLWVVRLAVTTCTANVNGWGFIDPEHIELRFEIEPDGEAPGFLTGQYLLDAGFNNSLALLFDEPTIEAICWVEVNIQMFLEECMFCVSSLVDLKSGDQVIKVVGYQHAGKYFPVTESLQRKCLGNHQQFNLP